MRKVLNMNSGWVFTKEPVPVPASMPIGWEEVTLPHTWNAIDGQDGGGDYHRGRCWYVKSINKSELPVSHRYYLELRGANSSADVYLNGEHLKHHDGGYSTWRVELTDQLKEENLLSVSVDNGPNDSVYPQVADFTFYGGLYRDVSIICVSRSHFDLDYYGSHGIRVTPKLEEGKAHVEIKTWIRDRRSDQTLRYTILDAGGNEVAVYNGFDTVGQLTIENVHLWNGIKDPYLYTAKAELLENGQAVDCVETGFGCRSFHIHPERGFILNGEEYPLRGVSRHQDRWGIGNALLPRHHKEDMDLICEMGCTTIRLAHYQHDQYFYDLCDQRGLVIWAEIPYISKHMPAGRENTVSQMTELIVQNYNHPSIVVWGLSNEITIGGYGDDLLENHRVLNDLCHKMDTTRLTTLAAVSPCNINDPYLKIPDVISYNHYFGWYGGETGMNGPWFDTFHAAHPNIPIGCSEYGCEALNWHTSEPTQGDYTEEYQAYYHEELIRQFYTRKYLWATHVWNMFDFAADARAEGGENGQNHKGLVTIDRKYKKDSFYAYKAWLSDEPFVHICGKRYVDRVEDVTRVTVYSNQPEVQLFVNGECLGTKTAEDHFFYFDVPNKGETVLEAIAGECRDNSRIRKVDVFPEAYRLKEQGAILNWYDIVERKGYLSLNSKMSDVLATFGGKLIFAGLAKKFMSGKKSKEGGLSMAGFDINADMMKMLGGFTALRLFNMIGSMLNMDIGKDELLKLNKKLNRIKAPRK